MRARCYIYPMQQLLSCLTLTGKPCCEYPYTLSGSDCVRQCLESYFSTFLNKKDTEFFVAMNFGIIDAECAASRKVIDIMMLIDLLVSIFEDAEARVANGLDPLTMTEVWEQNNLRCIAASLSRKYGFNMAEVYPLAGISDPTLPGLYPSATLPVPGSYSCGNPAMPDPDGPEPPLPDCFIPANAVAQNIVCEDSLQEIVLVTNTPGFPEGSGLFTPGTTPVGEEDHTYFWLNGIPIFDDGEVSPGILYWTMSFGDAYATFPSSGANPWDAEWHDTFGDGSEIPTVRQANIGDLCGSTIVRVQFAGNVGANGDYFSGPAIVQAQPGTTTYYMGEYVLYAVLQTTAYNWYLAKTGPFQQLYRSLTTAADPWDLEYESVFGVDPAPTLTRVPLFDLAIDDGEEGIIYSILCCDLPLFATYDEGTDTWTPYAFADGFMLESNGILYTDLGDGPGMLFPSVTLTLVGPGPNSYTISSNSPQTANSRIVHVEGFRDGAWVELWFGNEDLLPQNILVAGSVPYTVRAMYEVANCRYYSPSTLTVPPPGSCGTISVTVTPSPDCAGGSGFFVTVDIQSLLGFPIGVIIPTLNGVAQPSIAANLGVTLLGPYPIDGTVSVVVTNTVDSNCNYESPDLTSPQLPEFQYSVFMVADASYQSSALPGLMYLISGDTFNSGNLWASHVGETSVNNIFSSIPDGNIVYETSVPGLGGYWETVAGLPIQLYPPIAFLYNTVTNVWVAIPNPVAPYAAATDIAISFTCPTFGTEFIFVGVLDDFEQTAFAANCGPLSITGEINYFLDECPYGVPAIITTFTPTGEVDPGFSSVGLNNTVRDARSQTNDQMLVGGNFTAYGATPVGRFCRVLPDGTIDTVFNTALGAGFDNTVFSIGIEESGSSIVVGDYLNFNGVPTVRIARISSSGIQDAAFNANIGVGPNFSIRKVNILASGKILCTGEFSLWNGVPTGRIILLNQDGTVDAAFKAASGTAFNSTVGVCEIDRDGSIVMSNGFAGFYNGNNLLLTGANSIFRLNEDGTFNSLISVGTMFDADPTDISIQSDGKIVVTGAFSDYNGDTTNNICRLNTDGTIDAVFLANTGTGFSVGAFSSAIMPSGQIMIGCGVGDFNGLATNSLVLLNANGTRDVTYNTGPGPNNTVLSPVVSAFGNVWIYGTFTQVDGIARLRIARLN